VSVIMTLRVRGDPKELEKRAAANPDAIRALSDRAKEHGLIAHRFYGSEDGQIMVVDEWPDRESFRAFFAEARSAICRPSEAPE
jgi:heme-degrading monooxygenase HmoA